MTQLHNRITLVSSNLEAEPVDAVRWKPADWESFSGGNQLVWSDIRGTRRVAAALGREGLLHEMHQSWRDTASLGNIAFVAAMPSVEDSITSLDRIQRRANVKLPLVAHPNEQELGHRPSHRTIDYSTVAQSGAFRAIRYQITAELAANWSLPLDDPEALVEGMSHVGPGLGFSAEAIADTNLMLMDRGKHRFKHPEEIIRRMAARRELAELHFGVQPHFGGSPEHLKAMLDGDIANTPHGKMLKAALEETPTDKTLVVVTETPAAGFKQLGIPYMKGHHELQEQIQNFANTIQPRTQN